MPGGRSLLRAGFAFVPLAALVAVFALPHLQSDAPRAEAAQPAADLAPAAFELKKGDHICIIGNTLAERMQHDGWLETFLHARFPQHDLVFRNLGYSGDETRPSRLRSQDFGTPDQWLARQAPIPQPETVADKSVGEHEPLREGRTPRPT